MTRRVAVFARPPVPGRVKSRLVPGLTAPLACTLYRAMLADALAAARGTRVDERWIYWSEPIHAGPEASTGAPRPAIVEAHGAALDRSGFGERLQRGEGLGERLATAFAELLPASNDRAVVIGSDCPELDATGICRALDALDLADVVLGPTRDGGYYLAALKRPVPGLLSGIEWGSAAVLEQTLARARDARLEIALLDRLEDLDEPGDLVRLIARGAAEPGGRPLETLAALRRMGLLPGTPTAGA